MPPRLSVTQPLTLPPPLHCYFNSPPILGAFSHSPMQGTSFKKAFAWPDRPGAGFVYPQTGALRGWRCLVAAG